MVLQSTVKSSFNSCVPVKTAPLLLTIVSFFLVLLSSPCLTFCSPLPPVIDAEENVNVINTIEEREENSIASERSSSSLRRGGRNDGKDETIPDLTSLLHRNRKNTGNDTHALPPLPLRNEFVERYFASSLAETSSSGMTDSEPSLRLLDEIRTLINESYDDNDDDDDSESGEEKPMSRMLRFLVSTRRTLHRHPELMYRERFTSDVVRKTLDAMNINNTAGWGKNTHPDEFNGAEGGYGVVAHIRGGLGIIDGGVDDEEKDEPCVILRADMDGLPILEDGTSSGSAAGGFESLDGGRMHACGHDGHTAMLLGAAYILKKLEPSIRGTIRLIFQPAEEGGAGAKRMVEEGVVDRLHPPASVAYALHLWPSFPSGVVRTRPGPLLAAAESFEVLLRGGGGHAAMPHLSSTDVVVAMSHLVTNLQLLVSRRLSPLNSGVVTVTYLKAGDGAYNVIPAEATLRGTIRALDENTLIDLRDWLQETVNRTADLHRCDETRVKFMPDYYPPTVNDPNLYEFSSVVGEMVSSEGESRNNNGEEKVEPTMGAEDFAFFAKTVPSTFFLLGQGGNIGNKKSQTTDIKLDPKLRTDRSLHDPKFALDEEVMPRGVELHVNLALRTLKKLWNDLEEGKDMADFFVGERKEEEL